MEAYLPLKMAHMRRGGFFCFLFSLLPLMKYSAQNHIRGQRASNISYILLAVNPMVCERLRNGLSHSSRFKPFHISFYKLLDINVWLYTVLFFLLLNKHTEHIMDPTAAFSIVSNLRITNLKSSFKCPLFKLSSPTMNSTIIFY